MNISGMFATCCCLLDFQAVVSEVAR